MATVGISWRAEAGYIIDRQTAVVPGTRAAVAARLLAQGAMEVMANGAYWMLSKDNVGVCYLLHDDKEEPDAVQTFLAAGPQYDPRDFIDPDEDNVCPCLSGGRCDE